MTNISFSASASGAGVLTISAPNTNSNRTLTLPDATANLFSSADIATQAEAEAGTNNTKLMTPLRASQAVTALGTTVPSGTVMYFAASTAPTGWLKANGATVSRSTYSALFASIGTTFGAGDGSTTFVLPDLRGEFIRGWDDGRGVDSGRAFGSFQSNDIQSHNHVLNNTAGPSNTGNGSIPSSGAWAFYKYNNLTTTSSGGAETRPRNVALLACIKF